jgi:hypothetical protein
MPLVNEVLEVRVQSILVIEAILTLYSQVRQVNAILDVRS